MMIVGFSWDLPLTSEQWSFLELPLLWINGLLYPSLVSYHIFLSRSKMDKRGAIMYQLEKGAG